MEQLVQPDCYIGPSDFLEFLAGHLPHTYKLMLGV